MDRYRKLTSFSKLDWDLGRFLRLVGRDHMEVVDLAGELGGSSGDGRGQGRQQ